MLISGMDSVPLKLKFIWLFLQYPTGGVRCPLLSLFHHCLCYPQARGLHLDGVLTWVSLILLMAILPCQGCMWEVQWKSPLTYLEISQYFLISSFRKGDYSVTTDILVEGISLNFILKTIDLTVFPPLSWPECHTTSRCGQIFFL